MARVRLAEWTNSITRPSRLEGEKEMGCGGGKKVVVTSGGGLPDGALGHTQNDAR